MIYDGVITKPELTEENMLMHWGVKGMKWKKRLKGAYYRDKSKVGEVLVKGIRRMNLIKDPEVITGAGSYNIGDASISSRFRRKDNGKANSRSGREGSRVDAGIAAGRQRALEKALKNRKNRPGSRKKKVISGTTSVKKRK